MEGDKGKFAKCDIQPFVHLGFAWWIHKSRRWGEGGSHNVRNGNWCNAGNSETVSTLQTASPAADPGGP